MNPRTQKAFQTGYERMAGWSDLLDEINVFPVADADTGRNLRISLAPLSGGKDQTRIRERLLFGAVGNSGNIAAAFFSELIHEAADPLLEKTVRSAADAAWRAVAAPQPGTMLSVFDALAEGLAGLAPAGPVDRFAPVVSRMKEAVLHTASTLPTLTAAGVVDAGALGIYLFFEGFFSNLMNRSASLPDVVALFGDRVRRKPLASPDIEGSYCVSALVAPKAPMGTAKEELSRVGSHLVTISEAGKIKAHFHTPDPEAALKTVRGIGLAEQWSVEKIEPATLARAGARHVHLAMDAAGSISLELARTLGMTILDSYVVWPDRSVPETSVSEEELYAAMRRGERISTAQASVFERDQRIQSLVSRFHEVLYLCVGSVYTGNFAHAAAWRDRFSSVARFRVVDTGAASGRLAVLAIAVSRFIETGPDLDAAERFALDCAGRCEEFIFLDQLKYLAAGGRISKASGFFGDMLKIKPVISPTATGARKTGTARNFKEQMAFVAARLREGLHRDSTETVLLEYSDNAGKVMGEAADMVRSLFPNANILFQPLSRTSGAHMGPGTWGVAYVRRDSSAGETS